MTNRPRLRKVSTAVNHLFVGTRPVVIHMVAGTADLLHVMLKRSALRSERNAIRATSWAISSPCALKVIRPPNPRRPAVFWFSPSFKTTWSGSVSPLPAASKSRSFRCFQILERPSMPFLPVYTGVSSKTFRYLLMGPRQSLLQELQ
jgi:hypothetical protein